MKVKHLLLGIVALSTIYIQSQEFPVYSNGTILPSQVTGGVSFGSSITADDFILDQNYNLLSVDFSVFHTTGETLGPTLTWSIYADDTSKTGAVILSGAAQSVTRTPDVPIFDQDVFFDVHFEFGQPVNLQGGTTYWLGLNSPDGIFPSGLAWAGSQQQQGGFPHRLFPGDTFWTEISASSNLSFTLNAVPEPSAFILFSAIIGGTIFLMKKKKIDCK